MANSEDLQPPQWYAGYFNPLSHFHGQCCSTIAIFFIPILVVIIFILVHVVCQCGHSSINRSPNSRASTAATTTGRTQANKGLDASKISSLPSFRHSSMSNFQMVVKESECSICLGLFQENELLKVMPEYLHVFHSDCVDEWLFTRPSCPLCRASLDLF